LTHVWSNLFSNAIKFNQVNGKIFLSLSKEGNFAIVKVKDTGCGMTAEVGAHIFEKFYQGDTSHSVQGNGLGLALVKRVIDIMQGEIGVESAVGVGTTFTVKIRRI
jgi:signal transduction histidine kinase